MEVLGKTFTIGADPEVFMGKDGVFLSAHDAIPGDKLNPHRVKGGAVQVDGMALEFNVNPSKNLDTFNKNMDSVMSILKEMIGDKEFLNAVSVNFDEKFLETVPAYNQMLGCSADYNGWTESENQKPDGSALMRTVGGHVHIGGFKTNKPFHPDHYFTCTRLSRILDETVGVYSILWDKDDKRRSMYGQAGCFRPKPYGMEYRTLSNAWIFNKKIVEFIYNGVEEALNLAFGSDYEPDEMIRTIIDSSDRENKFFSGNHKADYIRGL